MPRPGDNINKEFVIPNGASEDLEDRNFSSNEADATCEATGDRDDVDAANGHRDFYNPNDDDDLEIDAGIYSCPDPNYFNISIQQN